MNNLVAFDEYQNSVGHIFYASEAILLATVRDIRGKTLNIPKIGRPHKKKNT